jgi:hypothetical protein
MSQHHGNIYKVNEDEKNDQPEWMKKRDNLKKN